MWLFSERLLTAYAYANCPCSPASATLNPDWVEWLMGWPVGWTNLSKPCLGLIFPWDTEPVPRVATNIPHRSARLRMLGNGQVPQAAVLAWTILHEF